MFGVSATVSSRSANSSEAAPALALLALHHMQQEQHQHQHGYDVASLSLSAAAFFSLSVALQRISSSTEEQQQDVALALQRVAASQQTLEDSLLLLRMAAAANPNDLGVLAALAALSLYRRDYQQAGDSFRLILQLLQLLLPPSCSEQATVATVATPLVLRPPHLLPAALLCDEDATALFSCFEAAELSGPLVLLPAAAQAVAVTSSSDAATSPPAAEMKRLRQRADAIALSLE